MSDLRVTLENVRGQVRARPGAYDRVLRRYRRRERNRRLLAGVTALAVAAAGSVFVIRALDDVRGGVLRPASPVIRPTNVSRSATVWTARVGPIGHAPPVLADGTVFVSSLDGYLYAFDARTGRVSWRGDTGGAINRPPAVADGLVFVHSTDGYLYAFAASCDEASCDPVWVGETGSSDGAPPITSDGAVYVSSSTGELMAFSTSCGSNGATCMPLWRGRVDGFAPAVGDGYVWDVDSGRLTAFSTECSVRCDVVHPAFELGGRPVSSEVAVEAGVVYVGSVDGGLYALSTACATGRGCAPLWVGETAPILEPPAIANGAVYAGTSDGKLIAFPTHCATDGTVCPPRWVAELPALLTSTPVVANGLVFAGSEDGSLSAFPTACGSGGHTCSPVWSTDLGVRPYSPVLWDDRALFVTTHDGRVVAFTVEGKDI